MQRLRLSRLRVVVGGAFVTALSVVACNSILDFDQFQVGGPDSGLDGSAIDTGTDATNDGQVPTEGGPQDDSGACSVDANACYPCAPTTTEQYLNACGDGTCIPFDQTRIPAQYIVNGIFVPPTVPDGGIK